MRSNLTGLTLLIITTKQSVTFNGKMYGKVQYHTPIPSHVPVKDLSPPINMMNYLTVSTVLWIIIIINNGFYTYITILGKIICLNRSLKSSLQNLVV